MREFTVIVPDGIDEIKVGWGQKSAMFPVKKGKAHIQVPGGWEFAVIVGEERRAFSPDGQPKTPGIFEIEIPRAKKPAAQSEPQTPAVSPQTGQAPSGNDPETPTVPSDPQTDAGTEGGDETPATDGQAEGGEGADESGEDGSEEQEPSHEHVVNETTHPVDDLDLTKAEIKALKDGGLETAEAIVDYLESHPDLTDLKGIAESTDAKIKVAVAKLFAEENGGVS